MTYKEAFELADKYQNFKNAWYKNSKSDNDFAVNRIKIHSIIVAPKDFQADVHKQMLLNNLTNKQALSSINADTEKDNFEVYLYSQDLKTDWYLHELLNDYLIKAGFL